MDQFIWKDRFSIGIAELDEQHKQFLEYVNECRNAVQQDHTSQVTSATIHDLTVYAETHFDFEYAVMQEIGYPDLEEQAREHAYFVKRIASVQQALAEGRTTSAETLLLFLRDWFLTHIIDHDRRLADHILAKKVRVSLLKSLAPESPPRYKT